MPKVVINACFGGFGLSDKGRARLEALSGHRRPYDLEIKRDDPHLVQVVEEMGTEAGHGLSELRVVEIPEGVEWQVEEYDGTEWVAEKHRTWDAEDKS